MGKAFPFDTPDGPVRGLTQDFDVEEFRDLLYEHSNRERIRWWRASIDPTYQRKTGLPNTEAGSVKWLREEQDCSAFLAVVSGTRAMKRQLPQGEFYDSDLTVMTMPDEIPLGDHDWVMPIGLEDDEEGVTLDGRLLQYKEPMVRGLRDVPGTGVLTANGNLIAGTNTIFTSELQAGDIIRAANQSLRVTQVLGDTSLVLEAPPTPQWNGNSWQKRVDKLRMWPAARLEEVRGPGGVYRNGVDYVLSPDGERVQWLTQGPAPDQPYSVIYRYSPIYEVLGDLGMIRRKGLPQTLTMRLLTPETIRE